MKVAASSSCGAAPPLHRLVVALHRVFGERSRVLVWLNSPNAELGGAAPIGLVMEGTLAGVIG